MAERLAISEWTAFKPLFRKAFQGPIPTPTDSIVVVEKIDGGKIIGFGVIRTYTVLESFWVEPDWRGRQVLTKLVAKMLDLLPGLGTVIVFTTSKRLVKLFHYYGMEYLADCKVLRWLRG